MPILDVYEEIHTLPHNYHASTPNRTPPSSPHFQVHNSSFAALLGPTPKIKLALEDPSGTPVFHEAAVFLPGAADGVDALHVTSTTLPGPSIEISRLARRTRDDQTWTRTPLPSASAAVPMANGGVNYPGPDPRVLYCAQGSLTHPGGLAVVRDDAPDAAPSFLATSFHGRWFNSVNDAVVARDGAVWFTDPIYGFEQGFRPRPALPAQVYRLDGAGGSLRAVAEGFGRPNGLCFDPAETTLYVTDTDWLHAVTGGDDARVSNIYAFSVEKIHGGPFLTNRRLFAQADTGIPDGIKCDTAGNVYSGCGDGVNVWAPSGVLLGKIVIPGGVANFCFGRPGEMFLLNETRFWVVNIAEGVRGDLLESVGIEV